MQNVQTMNQGVREIMVDLQAAGHSVGNDDIMITLFRAYSGSTNDEFCNSVMYWKNEWNSGSHTFAEELMIKADSKYDELKKALGVALLTRMSKSLLSLPRSWKLFRKKWDQVPASLLLSTLPSMANRRTVGSMTVACQLLVQRTPVVMARRTSGALVRHN